MSDSPIHPTAIISPRAELGEGVRVGPYAVIEGPCLIGAGCEIGPHAVIHPFVRLAEGVRVGPHATLGGEPQDLGFKGQQTWLEVGAGTVLREYVMLHRATDPEVPTRVGAGCYFMGHTHAGHDCQIGDGVILVQGVAVGGHVSIGDFAMLGGQSAVHQFARIGSRAMIGGLAKVTRDVLPFSLADGHPALHYRLNTVGLRRAGIAGSSYQALEQAFRAVREGRPPERLTDLPDTEEVRALRAFLQAPSRRKLSGFVRGDASFEG